MNPRYLSFLLLAGLLGGTVHANEAQHIQARHAWIRVLPGALPAGAYVTLENRGDQHAALTGASSPAYAGVMLHQSSSAGGMERMAMVDEVTIPAHGTASLAPAGYHLMLTNAVHTVKPGDTVRLSLKFSDGSTLPTDFVARPANAVDGGDDHHH
jgi:copper(I)-binding protein